MSNAIKFSTDNSPIDITVTCAPDGGLVMKVSDRGIGIPKDQIDIESNEGEGTTISIHFPPDKTRERTISRPAARRRKPRLKTAFTFLF